MSTILFSDYSFPLLGLNEKGQPNNVFGSSFCLAEDIYITCHHVIQQMSESSKMVMAVLEGKKYVYADIQVLESFENYDVALFRAAHSTKMTFLWDTTELPRLTNLQSFGYPFALDKEHKTIDVRGYKGYLVSKTKFDRLEPNPMVYELSFNCPRGLSGAFLLSRGSTAPRIKGMILGNSNKEIVMFMEEEIDVQQDNSSYYLKTETTTFGIALEAKEILNLQSETLGGSIQAFLKSHGKLAL